MNVFVWIFGCLQLVFGCLQLIFGCLQLIFGCLQLLVKVFVMYSFIGVVVVFVECSSEAPAGEGDRHHLATVQSREGECDGEGCGEYT